MILVSAAESVLTEEIRPDIALILWELPAYGDSILCGAVHWLYKIRSGCTWKTAMHVR